MGDVPWYISHCFYVQTHAEEVCHNRQMQNVRVDKICRMGYNVVMRIRLWRVFDL